jgi:hypothetical protein
MSHEPFFHCVQLLRPLGPPTAGFQSAHKDYIIIPITHQEGQLSTTTCNISFALQGSFDALTYSLMPRSNPLHHKPLLAVHVQVNAPTQAALFLTPFLVEMAGHGVKIDELERGLWSLEAWISGKRWSPGTVARLRAACRRLSGFFFEPAPPTFQWEFREPPGRPVKGERRFFRPFQATERLWVVPCGHAIRVPHGQTALEMEVGRARGTGIHPATRCCLRLLEKIIGGGEPGHVLDVGTGTGIVSLAAARFGASRILALDIAPHAVQVARKNVLRNHLRDRIKVQCRDVATDGGTYPLVVACLSQKAISKRSISLIHCLAPGGRLILGGIWWNRRDEILAIFSPQLVVMGEDHEAWWGAFVLGGS